MPDIEIYLSGGATNTDPDLSLGGDISSTQLQNNPASYQGTGVAGVTPSKCFGVVSGVGTLLFSYDYSYLVWNDNAVDGAATPHPIGADGEYLLQGNDGTTALAVNVTAASLPANNAQDQVSTSRPENALFRDISNSERLAGITLYRAVYIKNISGETKQLSLLHHTLSNNFGLAAAFKPVFGEDVKSTETEPFSSNYSFPIWSKSVANGAYVFHTLGDQEDILVWVRVVISPDTPPGAAEGEILVHTHEVSGVILQESIPIKMVIDGPDLNTVEDILSIGGDMGVHTSVTLTGAANGQPDLDISISSFDATFYRDKHSYITVSAPAAPVLIDDIELRPDGSLLIKREMVFEDTQVSVNDLALPFTNFRDYQGPDSSSVTLQARGLLSLPGPAAISLTEILSTEGIIENGSKYTQFTITYRSLLNINPGDTFTHNSNNYEIYRIVIHANERDSTVYLICEKQP